MRQQCFESVYWWDSDLWARCQLEIGHAEYHCDGVFFFDDAGIRVPASDPAAAPRFRIATVAADAILTDPPEEIQCQQTSTN